MIVGYQRYKSTYTEECDDFEWAQRFLSGGVENGDLWPLFIYGDNTLFIPDTSLGSTDEQVPVEEAKKLSLEYSQIKHFNLELP